MNAFNQENGFYVEQKENAYAIFAYETGEEMFFHEDYKKVQKKLSKLNKRVR